MTHDMLDAVHLTRTFDAPRTVLWRMWTDPDEFAAWYGPDGATVEVEEMDLRPGGRRLVVMEVETPGGPRRMAFVGEFREVVEPRRLVYTESTAGHPETEVEVELHEEDGRTTVVLTHHGIPAGSPGAAGWAMALDHLAERVAAQSEHP
jgi:uncharacterized protein YndB with AHSA1/START domain